MTSEGTDEWHLDIRRFQCDLHRVALILKLL